MKTIPLLVLGCALALGACNKHGDVDTTQTTGATMRSDDTKWNERDRSGATMTPVDQSNARGDIDVTAGIRKALVGNSDLSMNAKNVKIITRDGNVTLRGVVDTEAEKATIQDEAARIAGVRNVDNLLDVK